MKAVAKDVIIQPNVVICDFDNTLAFHPERFHTDWDLYRLQEGMNAYAESQYSTMMEAFLNTILLKRPKAVFCLCSQVEIPVYDITDLKVQWTKKMYPQIPWKHFCRFREMYIM